MSREIRYPYPFLFGTESAEGDFPKCSFTFESVDPAPLQDGDTQTRFTIRIRLCCGSLVERVFRKDAHIRILYQCSSTMLRGEIPEKQIVKSIPVPNKEAVFQVSDFRLGNGLIAGRLTFEAFITAGREIFNYDPNDKNKEIFGNATFSIPERAILAKTSPYSVVFDDDSTSASDIISLKRGGPGDPGICADFDGENTIEITLRQDLYDKRSDLNRNFRKTMLAEFCLPVLVQALTLLSWDGDDGNEYREKAWGKCLLKKVRDCGVNETEFDEDILKGIDLLTLANTLLGDVCARSVEELSFRDRITDKADEETEE